ncbi:MAG: hypothetical protein ACO4AI_11985 [Prochlorothrix sp.]|nr:hypothetical protein [Prochlorothrix sp.]
MPKSELQAMIPGLANAEHFSLAKVGEQAFIVVYSDLNSPPQLLPLSCPLPEAG